MGYLNYLFPVGNFSGALGRREEEFIHEPKFVGTCPVMNLERT